MARANKPGEESGKRIAELKKPGPCQQPCDLDHRERSKIQNLKSKTEPLSAFSLKQTALGYAPPGLCLLSFLIHLAVRWNYLNLWILRGKRWGFIAAGPPSTILRISATS